MLERRNKLRVAGALFAFLAALVFAYEEHNNSANLRQREGDEPKEIANDEPVGAPQRNSHERPRKGKAKKRFWVDYEPIEKFTFFLMLATIGLVVTGAIQIWTFIESERPFVSVPNVRFANELKAGVPFVVIGDLQNSGKTTAFLTEEAMLFHWQPRSIPLQRGLTKVLNAHSPVVGGPIVAGTITEMVLDPVTDNGKPIMANQAAIDAIANGDELVFVIGYVRYKDAFPIIGRTSTTGYCYVYTPHPADSRLSSFARCGNAEYEYAK